MSAATTSSSSSRVPLTVSIQYSRASARGCYISELSDQVIRTAPWRCKIPLASTYEVEDERENITRAKEGNVKKHDAETFDTYHFTNSPTTSSWCAGSGQDYSRSECRAVGGLVRFFCSFGFVHIVHLHRFIMAQNIDLVHTGKFTVWSIPAPAACNPASAQDVQQEEDANSSLSMLGGNFAMWMFAPPSEDDEQLDMLPLDSAQAGRNTAGILQKIANGEATACSGLANGRYWASLGDATDPLYPGRPLTAEGKVAPRESMPGGSRASLNGALADAGFAVVPPSKRPEREGAASLRRGTMSAEAAEALAVEEAWDDMARAVRVVQDAGFPPVFALMYDAPWAAVQRAAAVASEVLGSDCELEPSVFIWSLKPNVDHRDRENGGAEASGASAGSRAGDGSDGYGIDVSEEEKRTKYVGQNFGLPHRDFSYDEAHDISDGSPKILNVWLPFTDATPNNGCLWVVPREWDPCYSDHKHYNHSRPATPGVSAQLSEHAHRMRLSRLFL